MRKFAWITVALIGGYIAFQLIADVGATRLVQFGKWAIPGGTFVYALTFTWRDLVHKRLGKDWARAAIVVAGVVNLFMAGYFYWVAHMQTPVFIPAAVGGAWASIFAFVPAIVIGSIGAEIVSELTDTEVYHLTMARFTGKWQFMRVILSNAVSLPIDSVLFASMAFVLLPPIFGGSAYAWGDLPPIIIGQIAFKAIVTVVSMPLIYAIPERDVHESAWLDELYARENGGGVEGGDLSYGRARAGEEL